MYLKSPKGNDDRNYHGTYEMNLNKKLLNKIKLFLDVLQNYNHAATFPVKNEIRNYHVKKLRIE